MATLIEGHSVDHLLKIAEGVVQKKTKESVVLEQEAEDRIPKFDDEELTFGRILGRGGFCVVNEIVKITLSGKKKERAKQVTDEYHLNDLVQDRTFMEAHCIRQGKDYRYAIKKIQDTKEAQTFINAVVDLAVEARFLSVVRHPNIIKMRAMRAGTYFTTDFFVMLDRLYDILSTRLTKWKKSSKGGMMKMVRGGAKKEQALWVERVTVCYDLGCALKYLHDHNIVYRDLKPDNIGFDVRGDVKIFDFGLAKEFNPANVLDDGTYKLTGDTGSPRYMAPEVALHKPYNENADVYSFSILTWQILALDTPFDGYNMRMFRSRVVEGGTRPKCDPKWPVEVTSSLKSGWGDPRQRPSMEDMCATLREEVSRNTDGEVEDLIDASRKSVMAMNGN